jgi:hypothetical protein
MAFSVADLVHPSYRRYVRQPRNLVRALSLTTNDNAQLDQREYPRLFDELTDTVDGVKELDQWCVSRSPHLSCSLCDQGGRHMYVLGSGGHTPFHCIHMQVLDDELHVGTGKKS